MSNNRTVWSDDMGDTRKTPSSKNETSVNEGALILELRRMTSGKGRTVIEIKGLPANKKWCQQLAKGLKKKLGVGGTYKDNYIEIHGEKIEVVMEYLDSKSLKWKKTGG